MTTSARTRTIVTADPELDDLNSMIRLMLYTNEIDIEGLIYASSRYHWKGDGQGTACLRPEREYSTPQTSWRWAPGERFIDDVVDAYEAVHANLVVHDPRYPHPDTLRGVIAEGNVAFEGDVSQVTPGSTLIEKALLAHDPRPLHLQVWAGTSTIARALMSIEERFGVTEEWPDIRDRVSRTARITKFDSQDDTYDQYIRPCWPDIMVTDVKTWAWGYSARHLVLPTDRHLLGAEWMRDNVTSVGPLGALYRTWGDGRRMVDGDPTDYFHLSGLTADELAAQGFQVWTDPQPAGEWISEGDSTNLLHLLPDGLRSAEHPSFGGWGGRAERTAAPSNEWSVERSADRAPDGSAPPEYSVTRWFAEAQADFATRLRWSVTPRFGDAPHHPKLSMSPGCDLTVRPGQVVELSGRVESARDHTDVTWWVYNEAGTVAADVALSSDEGPRITLIVPTSAGLGETIHVIAEAAQPGGGPKAYRRIILTIGDGSPAGS